MSDRERTLTGLEYALEAAQNFHDGTDYDFARLTPDEQQEIIDAARRFASLTSQISEEELAELAQFVDDMRCHYDQKEKVHYIGLWKKTDVAPRVVLTALKVLRSVEVCPKCGGSGELHSSRCDLVYDLHCEHDPCPSCVSGVVTKKEPDDRSR